MTAVGENIMQFVRSNLLKLSLSMLLALLTSQIVEAAASRENRDFEALIDDYLGMFHGVGEKREPNDGSAGYYATMLDETRGLLLRVEAEVHRRVGLLAQR